MPVGIVIIGFIAFFIWQLKSNAALRQEMVSRKKEFQEAKAVSRHLKELEKKAESIKQREEELYKKIPLGEREPFDLIRAIIQMGIKAGLKKLVFKMGENTVDITAGASTSRQMTNQDAEGLDINPLSADDLSVSQEAAEPILLGAPVAIYLEVSFEGAFPQLLKFLEGLMNMERLVKIEEIRIERKKEILPSQSVFLKLTVYAFP